jgi:clorobiocin biosynthesis protein CloN5
VSDDPVTGQILAFVRENFQPDDLPPIDESTPLLDGILDSLKTAMLLNYLRDGLNTPVPPAQIDARNFRDVGSISAMVRGIATATGR